MPDFESADFKHSEREVLAFVKEYKATIYNACSATCLCRADWDAVVCEVAVKYANGKMEFDPSKNASMKTFVYKVARNEAVNAWKKYKTHHFVATDPEEITAKHDDETVTEVRMAKEDSVLRANEALNRLSAGCRNPKRIAIFIRHVLFLEPREAVARRFRVSVNTVSMAKTHLLPKFRRHLDDIAEEEAKGLYAKRGDKVFLRKEDFSS